MRRQPLTFKADDALRTYVENEATTKGWSVTGVCNDMMETQMLLEQALSEVWWEIEAEAVRARTSKGRVLADLVLSALSKKKK